LVSVVIILKLIVFLQLKTVLSDVCLFFMQTSALLAEFAIHCSFV